MGNLWWCCCAFCCIRIISVNANFVPDCSYHMLRHMKQALKYDGCQGGSCLLTTSINCNDIRVSPADRKLPASSGHRRKSTRFGCSLAPKLFTRLFLILTRETNGSDGQQLREGLSSTFSQRIKIKVHKVNQIYYIDYFKTALYLRAASTEIHFECAQHILSPNVYIKIRLLYDYC